MLLQIVRFYLGFSNTELNDLIVSDKTNTLVKLCPFCEKNEVIIEDQNSLIMCTECDERFVGF